MNSTERVLKSLDTYLRLMRYEYTTQEQLSRLEIIKDYYNSKKIKNYSSETVEASMSSPEELSGKLVLPLKVKGVFLTEGRPKARYYSADELAKAVRNPVNKRFPIMLDHKRKGVSEIIGAVTKLEFDENIKTLNGNKPGIRWWGHINDETFARNVLDGLVKEVSVTVDSGRLDYTENGLEGFDLTFVELSLVREGAEPSNYIEVDK